MTTTLIPGFPCSIPSDMGRVWVLPEKSQFVTCQGGKLKNGRSGDK
jgi:hypothetical protein